MLPDTRIMAMVYFIAVLLFEIGVAGEEQILSVPKNTTAFVGDTIGFSCEIQFSDIDPVLTYEFNDVPVYRNQYDTEEYPNDADKKYNLSVTHDGTKFTLTVKKASFTSAGLYKCKLTTVFAVAHLIVLDTPHLIVSQQEEGPTKQYTCKASFAGLNKHSKGPGQYPKLRMLLGGNLLNVEAFETQPNTSRNFHILQMVYNTVVDDNIVGEQLKCEIMTDNPKVVASTHVIIHSLHSIYLTTARPETKHDDSNGGTMATVVFFVVVNFLLLLCVIIAVIGYKYAKNKYPDVQKKFNYKPVSTKGVEAPSEPLATSTKADDAEKQKGKQHPDIKPSTEVHHEKHKVSLSHSDETATMKKADEADDLSMKTSVIQIESAPGKTAESLKQSEPSKKPDPVIEKTPPYPQSQQQDTSAAAQMAVGTNQRKINWNPQTQQDPTWQDTPHQPTNKQNPPIKDQPAPSHRPSPEQMQAVQQAKQGQGPDIQRRSEPPMSQTAGAHKDTTTRKSAPQPGESTNRKSDAQQELESPAQKAVREAKEEAGNLRDAADKATQEASVAEQDHAQAVKRVSQASKEQKQAAKEHAEKKKKKKDQLKKAADTAEKKAKDAEKKVKDAEKKAKDAEKKAEEARKKAEEETAKKTKKTKL